MYFINYNFIYALFIYWSSPHALCRLVHHVPVELWRSEHRLGDQREKADRLYVERPIEQEIRETADRSHEHQQELDVALELCPLPEVVTVELWRKQPEQHIVYIQLY